MSDPQFFIDDRCIIPDDIQRMSKEELEAEIARLEAEARAEKQRIIEQRAKETA